MRGRGGGEGVRTRDHLASVRTTLAWVRSGIVLVGIGYATDKLAVLAAAGTSLRAYGRPLGLLLVVAGIVLTAAGLPRYLGARRRIESPHLESRPWADLVLLGALGVGGVGILVLLAVAR